MCACVRSRVCLYIRNLMTTSLMDTNDSSSLSVHSDRLGRIFRRPPPSPLPPPYTPRACDLPAALVSEKTLPQHQQCSQYTNNCSHADGTAAGRTRPPAVPPLPPSYPHLAVLAHHARTHART
eukprot:GHVU01065423.1.p2 GENE.GHVU01065423.1~~GHVU01065423.1.p2  ORF type:complete len:123 (+),score=4.22 GHVU01065423.1:2261-2629(+)